MNNRSNAAKLFALVIAATASLAAPISYAEQQNVIEEVVVTARKTEESLLETPFAITALTAEDIELKGINELTDVVSFSPGFFYAESSVGKNSREHRRLIFRGMNPRTDLPHRAAATLFIDGASSLGAEFGAIENIERIEVLKGPQAAHFGRSTYAGAINIITKNPAEEFTARISADFGEYGHQRVGASVEGALTDWLSARATVSDYEMDGMYSNSTVAGEDLGARSTDDYSLTLFFQPSDSFDMKVRYHEWEDSDGPDAATLYDHRVGSGGEFHNCTGGGQISRYKEYSTDADLNFFSSFGAAPTVTPTFICGKVPEPRSSHIGMDTGSVRANQMRVNASTDWGLMPNAVVPDHFGLEREAEEISVVMNYNFDNGMNLNFIWAEHEDFYSTMNDLDRRETEGLYLLGLGGDMFGGFGANHPADAQDLRMNALEDSSWEIRLTSDRDKRFRWMIGYSDTELEFATQTTGSLIVYFPTDGIDNTLVEYPVNYNPYSIFSGAPTNINAGYGRSTSGDGVIWADVETTAVFGSIEFDVTDKLTLSLEVRRQDDEVTEGQYKYVFVPGDAEGAFHRPLLPRDDGLSDSFKSTLPRFIIDYKPFDETTIYASYSEGTRPGLFNASLSGLSPTELAQIKQQTGSGVEVDEEDSENIEIGLKTSFSEGRGFVTVTAYKTDVENVQSPIFAAAYTDDNGDAQVISGSIVGQGSSAELSGIEVEGGYIFNDNWSAEFTYAYNTSEIGRGFFSADAFDILGDSNFVQGNPFSRYPENSGTVSVDYNMSLRAGWTLFARADVIYTDKMYASQANITHTGSGTKLNLRAGVTTGKFRAELYCLNCTDDRQPKGLQYLFDFSGISGAFGDVPGGLGNGRGLSIALADKAMVGFRASYTFGGGD